MHCLAGISRSVTVTVAYLMQKRRWSLNDAYDFVKQRKTNVSPNFNFMGQLLDFEKTLGVAEVNDDGSVPPSASGTSKSQTLFFSNSAAATPTTVPPPCTKSRTAGLQEQSSFTIFTTPVAWSCLIGRFSFLFVIIFYFYYLTRYSGWGIITRLACHCDRDCLERGTGTNCIRVILGCSTVVSIDESTSNARKSRIDSIPPSIPTRLLSYFNQFYLLFAAFHHVCSPYYCYYYYYLIAYVSYA